MHRRLQASLLSVAVVAAALVVAGLPGGLGVASADGANATDFKEVLDFAVSPDGTKIAFTVEANQGELPGLYVANRDGSNPQRLADTGSQPEFSPDSRQIAFTGPVPSGYDLFVIAVAGGPATNLTNMGVGAQEPHYSPDGRTIALVSNDPFTGALNVTLVDVATGSRTIVARNDNLQSPAFSPDGAALLFSGTDGAGHQQVFSVPATGGTPTPLTSFSGSQIPSGIDVVTSGAGAGRVLFLDRDTVQQMNADGSGLSQIYAVPARTILLDAHWTPGGRLATLTYSPASRPPPGGSPTGGTGPGPIATTSTTSTTIAGPSPRSQLTIPTDPTTATVPPGGTLSSGPDATPLEPVAASVTSPNGGLVTVDTSPTDTTPPNGYTFAGQQVTITAPAATATQPLTLAFRIDASALAAVGTDAASVVVFRDGTPMADCDPATSAASPDPCVASRVATAEGDAQLAVRTSHASRWNFAKGPAVVLHPTQTAVACSPASVVVAATTTCTVTVSDTTSAGASPPAGSVALATDDPDGAFSGLCPLSPAGTGTSACTVGYRVSRSPVGNGTDTLSVTFSPAGSPHRGSSGSAAVSVGLRRATVQLSCSPSRTSILDRVTACTVVVSDGSPAGSPSPPAGTVSFDSSDRDARFSATSCTLVPAGGSASASSCQVAVAPRLALLFSRTDTIQATFIPSSTDSRIHAPGRASTTVLAQGPLR